MNQKPLVLGEVFKGKVEIGLSVLYERKKVK
jgi:hypothetical protein